jgi:hypothetical protein
MLLKGLGSVLAFLGIAPSVGNKCKWKEVQDLVGLSCHLVCDQVITNNIHT